MMIRMVKSIVTIRFGSFILKLINFGIVGICNDCKFDDMSDCIKNSLLCELKDMLSIIAPIRAAPAKVNRGTYL